MTAKRVLYLFSVKDCERLIEVGILTEIRMLNSFAERLCPKCRSGDLRVQCVDILNRLLMRGVGDDAITCIRSPIRLSGSELEPDVVVKAPSVKGVHSTAGILLLIEIAEPSLKDDREVKMPLCAANGIREFWIVNLVDGWVELYRHPQSNDTYAQVQILRAGDSVSLLELPSLTIPVLRCFNEKDPDEQPSLGQSSGLGDSWQSAVFALAAQYPKARSQ